jgi:hypothetical protein
MLVINAPLKKDNTYGYARARPTTRTAEMGICRESAWGKSPQSAANAPNRREMRFNLGLAVLALSLAAALEAQSAPAVPQPFVPSQQLNKQLPRWLRFSGEYRMRVEGFSGGGFRENNEDLLPQPSSPEHED